ncbi:MULTISPECIES: sugar phosphate isomerase/epimerase family protein [Niastella]|uniref:Sugar phosphate isomerase/epimerase n=1 Tax=Niastella soli TaxID=2821487 RepID=A0ABS3YQF0_9BACT|nr:sugar phosphate isomerase/epimerase [Niastella soli]MBO9199660.1 sugar phosphate isomerase/epimerase [Niastella soli]
MPTRRDFLRQSSLLTASLFVSKNEWFFESQKIGLQLYTLRNEMGKDAKGTLAKVAAQGYKTVETFGYGNGKWFGMNAAELRAELKSHGLTTPSGHTFPASVFLQSGWEEKWKPAVADAKAVGQDFIVIPWMEEQYRTDINNFKKLAATLNKAAEICKQTGIKLAYHNHDFEFAPLAGTNGYDVLLKETDPKLVFFEMDIYWVSKAGKDPLAFFSKHPGRFAMWHVKDMDNTPQKNFTEVGSGVINYKKIFTYAKQSGLKYFFVEQDQCPGAPLDSTAKSIAYLKKNIVK